MEIIKKDSKLYLKVYEIWPNTHSLDDWKRLHRFTNWDLAKKYVYELLGYSEKGSLFKGLSGLGGKVDEIEIPKPGIYLVYYSFKPDKKYAREKRIKIKIILSEITPREIEELRSLSL